MYVYIARRLLYAVLTFLGITVAVFVLIHSVPGDPISFYSGISGFNVSPAAIEAIRREHRLDEPLPVQYGWWLRSLVTLDLGRSIIDRRPILDEIVRRLPNTLLLNALAFTLAAAIGVPIGLWSARRPGRLLDRGSAVAFFLLYSLPSFWVALLLMRWLSVELGVLPLFGMTSHEYENLTLAGKLADRARHLVLPVVTLTYAQLAIFARFSRGAAFEVIRQDFITTARAKGVGEGAVIWHHAFRNALLPLITLLGLTIPYLISGSVIVEEIFQWDGIGLLFFDAIRARDYPVAMALAVLTAVATLLASLLADVLYAVADPRVRLAGARG
ncbi:MAG TPA: ABC transporter permease [Thermoanaerobaculia bacterium]|nr:ABC transporter permease [Thermoanaerobaculia bacterium]